MGAAMARSLAREGHEVAVWNRTPAGPEAVAGDAITAHADLGEAVTGAEVVVTMLYDADSVLEVAADLVAALGPEAVWVPSTTVGPEGMDRIAEAAGDFGGASPRRAGARHEAAGRDRQPDRPGLGPRGGPPACPRSSTRSVPAPSWSVTPGGPVP